MYGSDISNLSRLVKKLFRLYPLSKIVGKRILLRRRIRGNPDLSNLSRLVNAQRRARIGSRTEKSPSISLELRLHPAPPREIGNILKTMSTFPQIILGWVMGMLLTEIHAKEIYLPELLLFSLELEIHMIWLKSI